MNLLEGHILVGAGDPGLEGFFNFSVHHAPCIQEALVGFQLAALPGDCFRVDLANEPPTGGQGVLDLQVAVGVRELANPGLALVDDKAVLCGDFLYSLESLQQLFLAAVDDIGIIRIASEVPEAADDFAEVVHLVWIDNPYVLRLLVSNVHAFAEPLFTCKLRCWHTCIEKRVYFLAVHIGNFLVAESGNVHFKALKGVCHDLFCELALLRVYGFPVKEAVDGVQALFVGNVCIIAAIIPKENIALIRARFVEVLVKVRFKTLPVEGHAFSFLAGAVVVLEIFVQVRRQDLITNNMVHGFVLHGCTGNIPGFAPLFYDKLTANRWAVFSFHQRLLEFGRFQELVYFKELNAVLPAASLDGLGSGLKQGICVIVIIHVKNHAIGSSVITGAVMIRICCGVPAGGQPFLSHCRRRAAPIVCGYEIRADAVNIRGVVVVAIAIVVSVGEVRRRDHIQRLPCFLFGFLRFLWRRGFLWRFLWRFLREFCR